ncbi:STAS domain-containing protein [Blastococcus saxobsidens]|uniref:Anti-sigma factor antagonist n=1 Tax=Blastococcus saxobsidens TaxID=138336 RepID=A0A4Q7Y2R2_9ACTN|nr:STAS domain-containing protein [Blastococcus saxobsidens]RZU30798.1 anti-sigma B factor antagonist [Blastococcus saxobsidens]
MTPRYPVRIPRARVVVLDLAGDLRAEAREDLEAAYDEAASREPQTVVLNLSDVGYIDSTGIALLVGLLARARRDGRDVTAYGLSAHYRQIFTITRLSEFITIYDDEPSALGHVTASA